MTLAIQFSDIEAAAARLAGIAHRTPVQTSRTADAMTGGRLFFKCENLQRAGAFKFRGACNALARLAPDARRRGVIAFSSGNHAQAIALAAQLLGVPATLVMPHDAPRAKLDATRTYGAEVVIYDRGREDREALCRRLAAERGLAMIPPFDHPDVMSGQGTAALELIAEVGPLDQLVVCVGGGGLISGCAVAAARLSPECRVVGVEPAAGNDVQLSLRAGHIVDIAVPRTIADGAQTTHPGALTFPVIQRHVADIVTVDDAALVRAMRFFAARMKLVVEPTGCLAAAAVLDGVVPARGLRTGVIVSGGNVDLDRYAALLAGTPLV